MKTVGAFIMAAMMTLASVLPAPERVVAIQTGVPTMLVTEYVAPGRCRSGNLDEDASDASRRRWQSRKNRRENRDGH
jgi:hypothetical protein